MALYRAKVRCFVDNGMREEGAVFEYNGPRNTNLELVDKSEDAVEEAPPKKWTPRARRSGADDANA